jgi:hypothetical protein
LEPGPQDGKDLDGYTVDTGGFSNLSPSTYKLRNDQTPKIPTYLTPLVAVDVYLYHFGMSRWTIERRLESLGKTKANGTQ